MAKKAYKCAKCGKAIQMKSFCLYSAKRVGDGHICKSCAKKAGKAAEVTAE